MVDGGAVLTLQVVRCERLPLQDVSGQRLIHLRVLSQRQEVQQVLVHQIRLKRRRTGLSWLYFLSITQHTHTHTYVRTHSLSPSRLLCFSPLHSLCLCHRYRYRHRAFSISSLPNSVHRSWCYVLSSHFLCVQCSFYWREKKKKKKTQTHTHTLVLIPIPASAITPHFLTLTGPHLWHATPLLLFSESDLLAVLGSDTSCKYTSQGHLPYIHIHTLI